MDGQRLQQILWRGYARSAKILGDCYIFYRPSDSDTPTAWASDNGLANQILSQSVSLNAEDMKYSKPNKYGKPTWYAVMDGAGLQPGDYFIGPQGTFFIAALQPLLPILVVECNRVVSISRVTAQATVGAGEYGGMTSQNEAAYITGAPCSILQGTKGEKSDATLPGDTRMPWWNILAPAQVGRVIYGDLIIDDRGLRYVVSSAELTDLGYRLTATLAMT